MIWSEPWEAIANTAPPTNEGMNDPAALIGLPSKTNICGFPAAAASASHPPPTLAVMTTIARTPPRT